MPRDHAWYLQKEIDFCAGCRAIEAGYRVAWRSGNQIFDDESFPTCARYRMAGERAVVPDAEQGMYNAAVPDKHFRRFHQALADVAVKRREPAHSSFCDQLGQAFTRHLS